MTNFTTNSYEMKREIINFAKNISECVNYQPPQAAGHEVESQF